MSKVLLSLSQSQIIMASSKQILILVLSIGGKAVYELPTTQNKNLLKHLNFIIEETDLFGIINLIS